MKIFVKPSGVTSLATTIVTALTGVAAHARAHKDGAFIEFWRSPELTETEIDAMLRAIRADGTHAEVVYVNKPQQKR